MGGWPLEYVQALDRDVRQLLIDEINHVNKGDDDSNDDDVEDW